MHNKTHHLGLVAAAALFVSVGCVPMTTVGGTADPHGLFTGHQAAENIQQEATEIASYRIFAGLVDVGYDEYVKKVNEATAKGKKVSTKTLSFPFVTIVTAYAK